MAIFTPRFNLRKPDRTEYFSIVRDFNDNWDKLDLLVAKETDLQAVESRVDAIESDVVIIESDIDSLELRTTTAESDIDNLELSKVDKITGKGLSENDYTDADKLLLTETIPAQLAEIEQETRSPIEIPEDFIPELPCNFTRLANGDIIHDMEFDQYRTGVAIYIDSVSGNDTSGTGTEANPYKSMNKAYSIVESGTELEYVIYIKNNYVNRNQVLTDSKVLNGKRLSIIALNENTIYCNGQNGLSWTLDGTGTWKTNRTSVNAVFDLVNKDKNQIPLPFKYANTLVDCQNEAGTWHTDGTSVWVHTKDSLAPTENTVMVGVSILLLNIELQNQAVLYVENIQFLSGSGSGDVVKILNQSTVPQGEFISKNCRFIGGILKSGAVGNGLTIVNIKTTLNFDSICAYNSRDGFNYHYDGITENQRRNCFVLEYNCKSYSQGAYDNQKNNNATSAHEGISILRIKSEGYDTNGPVLADVGGCYSICHNCKMHDSKLSDCDMYLFSSAGAKVYIYNSSAGGFGRFDLISSPEPVHLKNFQGYRFSVPLINYV